MNEKHQQILILKYVGVYFSSWKDVYGFFQSTVLSYEHYSISISSSKLKTIYTSDLLMTQKTWWELRPFLSFCNHRSSLFLQHKPNFHAFYCSLLPSKAYRESHAYVPFLSFLIGLSTTFDIFLIMQLVSIYRITLTEPVI